jgi:large-conductance mechanosensitive channel
MGIDNVIKLAVAIVMAAALTGQLPKFTMAVRRAQVQLLQESKASNWGSPDLLYSRHR